MFKYETKSGETVKLPPMADLPFGVVRKIRHTEGGETVFQLIEAVADKKTLAIVDGMPQSEVISMFEAWNAEALEDGAELGKSGASSKKSKSTGTR